MTKQPVLTDQQIRDLRELMALPDDVRTRLIDIATGLMMGASLKCGSTRTA